MFGYLGEGLEQTDKVWNAYNKGQIAALELQARQDSANKAGMEAIESAFLQPERMASAMFKTQQDMQTVDMDKIKGHMPGYIQESMAKKGARLEFDSKEQLEEALKWRYGSVEKGKAAILEYQKSGLLTHAVRELAKDWNMSKEVSKTGQNPKAPAHGADPQASPQSTKDGAALERSIDRSPAGISKTDAAINKLKQQMAMEALEQGLVRPQAPAAPPPVNAGVQGMPYAQGPGMTPPQAAVEVDPSLAAALANDGAMVIEAAPIRPEYQPEARFQQYMDQRGRVLTNAELEILKTLQSNEFMANKMLYEGGLKQQMANAQMASEEARFQQQYQQKQEEIEANQVLKYLDIAVEANKPPPNRVGRPSSGMTFDQRLDLKGYPEVEKELNKLRVLGGPASPAARRAAQALLSKYRTPEAKQAMQNQLQSLGYLGGSQFSGGGGAAPKAGGRPKRTVNGVTKEWDGSKWVDPK